MIISLFFLNVTLTIINVLLFTITKDNFFVFCIIIPGIIFCLLFLINFYIHKNFSKKLKTLPILEQRLEYFNASHKLIEKLLNNIDMSIALREENLGIKYTNYYFSRKDPSQISVLENIDKLPSQKINLLNEMESKKHKEIREIVLNNRTYLYEFTYIKIDNKYICSTAYEISPSFYYNKNNIVNQ